MSVLTNVLTKMKQAWYNTGANSEVVAAAVDKMEGQVVSIRLPSGADGNAVAAAADSSVLLTVPWDCRLMSAYFVSTPAIVNTEAMDVVVSIATNGVTAGSYNSNAAAQGAVAANGVATFSMTTDNSYVDAGEKVLVAYTMADNTNNYLDGILTMNFYKV